MLRAQGERGLSKFNLAIIATIYALIFFNVFNYISITYITIDETLDINERQT